MAISRRNGLGDSAGQRRKPPATRKKGPRKNGAGSAANASRSQGNADAAVYREALEDQARLTAIVNTAVDAIVTIDERGIIGWINPATEQLFGYTAAELVGRNVKLLMPEPYRREHDGYLRSYVRTGRAKIIGIGREVTGQRKDGSTFPMSLAVSEMRLGRRRMFTGIVHDLTGRRQLERQVLEVAAAEQRRIGQDLHDGLCQELVSLSLGLELVARKLATNGRSAEAAGIDKLGESLQAITTQARQLAHGLNPVDVEGDGLPGALEQLAARISESTTINCKFHWDRRAQARDGSVATNLYRIAQEAVSNAIKHARPSRIDLHLVCGGNDELTMRIEDDGRGLPDVGLLSIAEIAAARELPPRPDKPLLSGIGLQTMNYRARLIGGTFDIRPASAGRKGTVVTCSIRCDGSSAKSPAPSAAAHRPPRRDVAPGSALAKPPRRGTALRLPERHIDPN
jgi:two-component system, LuxR family, sensor kinase FixL